MVKHEYNPPTSDPHIPDVRNCGCAACRERDELRAELEYAELRCTRLSEAFDKQDAELERLRADVLTLNGMVAMLNERLVTQQAMLERASGVPKEAQES